MSTTTDNLHLFKYTEDDYNMTFDCQTALNDNWDIIDEYLRDTVVTIRIWGD